jgi:hypothetical protein
MELKIGSGRLSVTAAGVAVMAVLLLGAVAGEQWRNMRAHRTAEAAIADELASVNQRITAALDSTKHQIERAEYFLGWLELNHEASSAALVHDMSSLRYRYSAPASLTSVAELAATGGLDVVSNASLRRRLLALDRRLAIAQASGDAEFELYRTRLEEALSPGMWRYVFHGESGKYAVDYRAALRELHAAGFDRALRSVLRGLQENRDELAALASETRAVLSELQQGHSTRAEP